LELKAHWGIKKGHLRPKKIPLHQLNPNCRKAFAWSDPISTPDTSPGYAISSNAMHSKLAVRQIMSIAYADGTDWHRHRRWPMNTASFCAVMRQCLMSVMCGLDRLLIPYRERHPVAAKWPRTDAGDDRHLAPTLGWNILSFQDIKKHIAL
jgi:hypothetical protein